jgi:RND superfamily putative drug exporter
MAIVPSLMFLIGRPNWWFPDWLDRILPRLGVDPELPPVATLPEDPATESESEPVRV